VLLATKASHHLGHLAYALGPGCCSHYRLVVLRCPVPHKVPRKYDSRAGHHLRDPRGPGRAVAVPARRGGRATWL